MCKLSLSGSRDRIKYLLSLVLKVDIKIVQLDLLVVVFYSFISYLQSVSLSLHFHRVIGQHAIGFLAWLERLLESGPIRTSAVVGMFFPYRHVGII